MDDLKRGIEAILFAAGRVVSEKELQELVKAKPSRIRDVVAELKAEYDSRGSSMMVVEEKDGWKLTVRESVLPLVHTINPHTELSKTILETLAVIAWKQPVLQSDVIKVRTNKAYDHIAELETLGFIAKERFGRSYALRVTQKFMDYFDLPDDKAVKELFKGFKDVEVAVQKKMEEFEKEIPEQDKVMMESRTEDELEEIATKEAQDELGMATFSDELPPVRIPEKEPHLSIYSGQKDSEVQPSAPAEDVVENDLPAKAVLPVRKEQQVESEDEKARRIARELLEEDQEEKAKQGPMRTLHPELEDFIAGEETVATVKPMPPKETVKTKPAVGTASAKGPLDSSAGSSIKSVAKERPISAEPKKPASVGVEKQDEDDKPKPAEEFPGQFDDSNKT